MDHRVVDSQVICYYKSTCVGGVCYEYETAYFALQLCVWVICVTLVCLCYSGSDVTCDNICLKLLSVGYYFFKNSKLHYL